MRAIARVKGIAQADVDRFTDDTVSDPNFNVEEWDAEEQTYETTGDLPHLNAP